MTIWYTAPTALRLLMKDGLDVANKFDFGSLRYITSVGEPLNPEVIRWGLKAFNLPIHDNWWMTETGQILIANYPCMSIREGSMGRPFPSITASIVDDAGNELPRTRRATSSSSLRGPRCCAPSGETRRSTRATSRFQDGTRRATARFATRTATSGSWGASTTS